MRPKDMTIAGCLVLGLSGTAARAQLVTQPPRYVLGPEDRIAVVVTLPVRDRVIACDMKAKEPQAQQPPRSLVVRNSEGRVVALREPAELAALRINPLIAAKDRALIAPVLIERQRAFERIVIDNLDLVEQVDGGLFETIDLSGNKAFTRLLDVATPLRPPGLREFSRMLVDRGLLTQSQASENEKITREYNLAVVAESVKALANGQDSRRALALMYKQSLDEPLTQARRVRLEAAQHLTTLIPSLGLDKPTTDSLLEAAGKQDAKAGEDALLAALGRVNAKLTLDQRKELLRHMAAQQ